MTYMAKCWLISSRGRSKLHRNEQAHRNDDGMRNRCRHFLFLQCTGMGLAHVLGVTQMIVNLDFPLAGAVIGLIAFACVLNITSVIAWWCDTSDGYNVRYQNFWKWGVMFILVFQFIYSLREFTQ